MTRQVAPLMVQDNGETPFVAPQHGVTPTAASHLVTKDYVDALIAGLRYRVGDIYTTVVATSPATTLGYGTWSAFGTGRVLVGVDTSDESFDTVEETGGAKTVAAAGSVAAPAISGSVANEGAHTHSFTAADNTKEGDLVAETGNFFALPGDLATGAGSTHSHGAGTLAASAPAFTGSATSVVQPYITVYMWKRTA